jgi:hypothetical protein
MTNEEIDFLVQEIDYKIKNKQINSFGDSIDDVFKIENGNVLNAIKKYKNFKEYYLILKQEEKKLINLKDKLIKLKNNEAN